MDVLIILVFASLVLVGGALILLLSRIRGGDFEHGDRLSLLPLEPDQRRAGAPPEMAPETPEGETRTT